jgi:hypothetical protein
VIEICGFDWVGFLGCCVCGCGIGCLFGQLETIDRAEFEKIDTNSNEKIELDELLNFAGQLQQSRGRRRLLDFVNDFEVCNGSAAGCVAAVGSGCFWNGVRLEWGLGCCWGCVIPVYSASACTSYTANLFSFYRGYRALHIHLLRQAAEPALLLTDEQKAKISTLFGDDAPALQSPLAGFKAVYTPADLNNLLRYYMSSALGTTSSMTLK